MAVNCSSAARRLMTKVLLSPYVAQGPDGISSKSDEFPIGHISVLHSEKIAHCGRHIESGAFVEVGKGRSGPKTYCQLSVRKGPASSHCA